MIDLDALRELGLAFGLLNRQWRMARMWKWHREHAARGEHWAAPGVGYIAGLPLWTAGGCEYCRIASTPPVRRSLGPGYRGRPSASRRARQLSAAPLDTTN